MSHLRNPFFLGATLLASLAFTYHYFLYTHEYPPGSYQRIAAYEADKVFQTRILVTTLANMLEPTLPLLQATFHTIVPYPIDYEVLLQLLNVCFLSALLLSMPSLLKVLEIRVSPWWSFLLLLPLYWNYVALNGLIDGAGLYYPYDLPSLTFFTIGVILFIRCQWLLLYPWFVIALLNRESACFLTLAGFILSVRFSSSPSDFLRENRHLLFHVSAQACLWIGSRLLLSHTFRDNPGEFFETPHSMTLFLSHAVTATPHWAMENPRWFLTLFAGIWLFPLLAFKKLNSMTRRFLIVGVIYLTALIFRSNMMETRVYNELNVVLTTAAIAAIHSWLQTHRSTTYSSQATHA